MWKRIKISGWRDFHFFDNFNVFIIKTQKMSNWFWRLISVPGSSSNNIIIIIDFSYGQGPLEVLSERIMYTEPEAYMAYRYTRLRRGILGRPLEPKQYSFWPNWSSYPTHSNALFCLDFGNHTVKMKKRNVQWLYKAML